MIKKIIWYFSSLLFGLILLFFLILGLTSNGLSLPLSVFRWGCVLIISLVFVFSITRNWKNNKALSLGIMSAVCIGFLFFNLTGSYISRHMGGISNLFNSSYLLKESDTVCKVQSLSSSNFFWRIIDYGIFKRVAVVKTVSTIKGTCPEKFIIKRHREDSRDDSLGKDEVALVFLKKHADGFRYYDAPNGKFVLNSSQAKYLFGDKPSDKLLAELINYAQTQNGTGRLAAIEELSNLNDARAIEYLRFVLSDGNLVEKKWAIWALICLKNPPSVEELMRFFDDVNESPYSKEGDITFGDGIYRNRDLINETIVNLGDIFYGSIGANKYVDLSLAQIQWDFKNRIVGFDYASFCRQAMSRDYIKNIVSRKRNIAVLISKLTEKETLDLFAEFLKDDDIEVNYFAVAGLAKIFHESIPAYPDFQKNQKAILNQWRQRIMNM